jgi:hypothetical protein
VLRQRREPGKVRRRIEIAGGHDRVVMPGYRFDGRLKRTRRAPPGDAREQREDSSGPRAAPVVGAVSAAYINRAAVL